MENKQQSTTDTNNKREKAGTRKFVIGIFAGMLIVLCLGGVFWVISTGKAVVWVNRASPVSTAKAIAVAFLNKNHDQFMKFVPPTNNLAFRSGWWEDAEYIQWMLLCNGKSNEFFRNKWLQGPIENYGIDEVLVANTDYPQYKTVDIVIRYDGDQYIMTFWMENLSNKWWAMPGFGLCFE